MKFFFLILLGLPLVAWNCGAAIVVPGADGSDGALNITADTVIDLSQAVDGVWDADNSANAGKGIYDKEKWAVVFKYSSVNIAGVTDPVNGLVGAKVTFKNHPSGAPVVWLVSGNVVIDGIVDLSGEDPQQSPAQAQPGPGGFRGGFGPISQSVDGGAGQGFGGGAWNGNPSGGSYAYGNPSLVPLIGGSGGGAADFYSTQELYTRSGAAGGGAMLVASQGSVALSGRYKSNGGDGFTSTFGAWGGGAGGGIRFISDSISGTGQIEAKGGGAGVGVGGNGRIRLERVTAMDTLFVTPSPSTVDLAPGATALIWPPSTGPEVTIISVGGDAVPDDPRASFGALGADVQIPDADTTEVIVETRNVEQASQVIVRVTPRFNAQFTETDATVQTVVSASPLVVRWRAFVPTESGYSAMQVRVIRP